MAELRRHFHSRPSQGFLVTGVFRELTDASHEGIVDRWEPPGLDVGGVY